MTASAFDKADLVIRGARLIDGTGGPSAAGDLAVVDDRIAAMGEMTGLDARIVAPEAAAERVPVS